MLSAATLERVSPQYREGYYNGYYNRPKQTVETGLDKLGDDPIGGVLRPFGQVDYDNGYEAGDNDAHWGRVHSKQNCPATCQRCKRG